MSQQSQTTVIEANVYDHNFTWEIVNFSKTSECLYSIDNEDRKDPPIESRIFQVDGSQTSWRLLFYPGYNYKGNSTVFVVFELKCESEDPDAYPVTPTMPLIDSAGELGFIRKEEFYVRRDKLVENENKYLPNDTLTMNCRFKVVSKCNTVDMESRLARYLASSKVSKAFSAFATFFDNKELCDVLICCDGSEFQAHKLILSASSPVFASMLQHDMLETRLNEVHISDISATTFERLLHYVYGKAIENLRPVDYMNLYESTDKYQLLELKHHCASVIAKNLDTDVVCQVARLAERHCDNFLFTSAQNYVKNNANLGPFLSSNVWIDFVLKSPFTAARLFSSN